MGRRWAAALALTLGLLAGWPGTAHGGGGRLAPVRDRYDPGEVATLVGYTSGSVPDVTFDAYLRQVATGAEWYVGALLVEETGHSGYLAVRVSVAFEVPADAESGDYEVIYCDALCTGALLGDLVASPLSIGIDPGRRVVREWALDDPEIASLDGDALLVGPGFQTTAAALRAPPTTAAPVAAPAPVPMEPVAATARTPEPPVPAAAPDDMAWPLPTALVVGGAAASALFCMRRQRAVRPRAAASAWVPSAGRG